MRKIFYLFIAALAFAACDKKEPTFVSEGALKGKFTINAAGDRIVFSKGNLQYVGTWQFATNQWETIANAQADDHRDLFGWGTGDAPNKVSTDNNDYSTFVDWGANPITNGGNKANQWRTLTKDEWNYLFYTRENAATLFALGSVNGRNGTILLPDNWTLPEGASFSASTTLGLVYDGGYYYNEDEDEDNFSHNTYTIAQWETMEAAGAVFLPAADDRYGTDMYDAGLIGCYWSASPCGTKYAYYLFFNLNALNQQSNRDRYYGNSVRLVQDVRKK